MGPPDPGAAWAGAGMSTITDDQILDEAANVLDELGWCRGASVDNSGRHCLVGALRVARRRLDPHSSNIGPSRALRVELGRPDYVSNYPLVHFNDTVAKDKRYVTRLLRRTARKLRSAVSS